MRKNITRLGLKGVTIVLYAQLEQGTTEPFDAILFEKLTDELLLLPSAGRFDHDGGYIALLVQED